jgi:hypothetical protein
MLIKILQNTLKILLFALLFSLEISIAIPLISTLFILTAADRVSSGSQVFLLLASSLIMSSFLSVSWSLVILLLGVGWLVFKEALKRNFAHQNASMLVSMVLAVVLASFSEMTFNYKTVIYTVLLTILAIGISRVFLPRRVRHSMIDWISSGRSD